MSINFLNNGIGPGAGGCTGQSPQNCSPDYNGCTQPGGPIMHSRFANGQVSFTPMSHLERNQWMRMKLSRPAQKKMVTKNLPSIPSNGVAVV